MDKKLRLKTTSFFDKSINLYRLARLRCTSFAVAKAFYFFMYMFFYSPFTD
ncbi:MAG TPA: hypothetical protein PK482_04570 [Spirochaetota bacterium]|nr:hypothetical protein [Spirochaetota bacterium]